MTEEELFKATSEAWESTLAAASYSEQLKLIHRVEEPEVRNELYLVLCSLLTRLLVYSRNDDTALEGKEEAQALLSIVPFLSEDCQPYYQAVADYIKGNLDSALNLLEQEYSPDRGYYIDEYEFAHNFLIFYKTSPAFWDRIIEILEKVEHDDSVIDLAQAVKLFYFSDSDDVLYASLTKVIQSAPNSELANELLGVYYMKAQRWANAAASFERVNNAYTMTAANVLFDMGWCYGEIGDHNSEIDAYERCLDIDPYFDDARNNLGLAYYKIRKFPQAAEVFEKCIEMGKDLKYACSNYVVALVALGKYNAAHQFIKTSPCKVRKYALDRLKAAESGKLRISSAQKKILEEESVASTKIPRGNVSQFSSEKLLEDELEARLRNGSDIFGVNLKIYRRKGAYGQQFIIPVGRLDLLAEDDEGGLYVIELKKDSGYDDAFAQTKQYVDYLEKSDLAAGKPVKGIICLSEPTPELIKAVKGDDRISLFEYQISYTKIV